MHNQNTETVVTNIKNKDIITFNVISNASSIALRKEFMYTYAPRRSAKNNANIRAAVMNHPNCLIN